MDGQYGRAGACDSIFRHQQQDSSTRFPIFRHDPSTVLVSVLVLGRPSEIDLCMSACPGLARLSLQPLLCTFPRPPRQDIPTSPPGWRQEQQCMPASGLGSGYPPSKHHWLSERLGSQILSHPGETCARLFFCNCRMRSSQRRLPALTRVPDSSGPDHAAHCCQRP